MAQAFPSLTITRDRFIAEGPFAEAQADFLSPDPSTVAALDAQLKKTRTGVVAHFYMDPELQGVLNACRWPHVHISDSLLMADAAVKMVEAGCEQIIVLGVDFMSENARAMLDAAGHGARPVYRVAAEPIGCSLAEAAESEAYRSFLQRAQQTPNALHVIYINTSLKTKAEAHQRVPTLTCTSSNVVQTVLQAAAQIEDVEVFFGPDTYMGQNIESLLRTWAHDVSDEAIAAVHPAHNRNTIAALLPRFHAFQQGACMVHHMFGRDVAERLLADYRDAYITAHLEVPSEMFALALDAQRNGRGVVGSTANILAFINERVAAEASRPSPPSRPPRFVLGTEAGMITSIVKGVRERLQDHPEAAVEIVFPVASEAIARGEDAELPILPGAQSGEGCTTAGGCATCPYMKMNSLDALRDVLHRIETGSAGLDAFRPRTYGAPNITELGGAPILHMRHLQRKGSLDDELVRMVQSAGSPLPSPSAPQ